MKPVVDEMLLSDVVFDSVIYPRKDHSPELVQRYASVLDEIVACGNHISVSADNKLLDGKHRWLAFRKDADGADRTIQVFRYNVRTPHEQLKLAASLNSTHGCQLSDSDKQSTAIAMHGYGES